MRFSPGLDWRGPPVTSKVTLARMHVESLRFDISGRAHAERILARGAVTHLVSFRDVGATPLRVPSIVDRIELEFDDASSPASAAFGYRPPEAEDLRLLVHWLREREAALKAGAVLFQCEQGLSRSPAAAIIALCVLGHPAQDARKQVLHKQPRAVPNPLMLSLAGPLLGN